MAIYGLLVGINDYRDPTINKLGGCINDVTLFSGTLKERFLVPEQNLQILTDQDATHDGIIASFRTHLTQRAWQPNDVAVFYFSGHGGQSLAPEVFWDIEPDHMNESLVCHDSRTPDTPDLLDKELRFMIAELAKANCQHITVILDCCHGGHGTRFVGEGVRSAPPDMTQYPLTRFAFGKQTDKSIDQVTLNELLPESGKHILLAGCQDYQFSLETLQGSNADTQRHGLFTYAMCQTLSALKDFINYQELRNRIYQRVQSQALTQNPQIEAIGGADITQQVFGEGLLPLRMLAFKANDEWKLNAGIMQGLNVGDEVALFDDGVDTRDLKNRLAKATIRVAESFTSILDIADSENLTGEQYTAIVTLQNLPREFVRLKGNDSDIQVMRNILQQDNSPSDPGRFLLESTGEQKARYVIRANHGDYAVTVPGDNRPLFETSKQALAALEQVAVMARWHQKLTLKNLTSDLEHPVEIVVTYNGQEYINQDVTLEYAFKDGKWEQPRINLELRLKEKQPRLYCALLYFDGSTGGIFTRLAPGGWLSHEGSEQEGQSKAQPIGKVYEGKILLLKIGPELLAQGITRVQDSLKLIVCEQEFDSSLFIQQGMKLHDIKKSANRSVLKNSLERFANGIHNRSPDFEEDTHASPDWTTEIINLTIIHPQETKSVSAQQPTPLLGQDDVRIEPHPKLHAQVRLVSSHPPAAANGVKGVSTPDPAPFTSASNAFTFSEGRGADFGLDTLEVFLSGSTEAVSPETPLQLSLKQTLAEGEQIVPYAYDRENQLFLPVGYSEQGEDGRTHIAITDLPASAAMTPVDGTKSLGSALKIFFRKLVYRDLLRLDVGVQVLGIPIFDSNDPTQVSSYETSMETIAARVETADSILLVIHGIIGHTSTIAGCVNLAHSTGQPPIASHYSEVLTFDYENLNTPIEDTAKALKTMLAQVGIKAGGNKRIDILAHSMGGLVARQFIEHEDGHHVVNTLVMVGTPNGGSPIATLKAQGYAVLKPWVYGNLLAAINGLTTAYLGGAVIAALMKLLDAVDNCLDQMEPNNGLIKNLAESPAPPNVRYAVIAGDIKDLMIPSSDAPHRLANLLDYLGKRFKLAAYDVLTDKLFKAEANDMAVACTSMQQFNPAWRDNVVVENVRCDHLSYFAHKGSVALIAEHLGK